MDRSPRWEPLRSLPTWLEMTIVVVIAFGTFIYSSTYYAMTPGPPVVATANDFRALGAMELLLSAVIFVFLWARGWTWQALGIVRPTWRDLRHGAALFVAVIVLGWIAYYVATLVQPNLEIGNLDIEETGIPIVLNLAFSATNSSFEEIFVCAYVVAAWRRADIWSAIAISSALRLSYHLYQGPLSIAMIFPLGVLFAWYFASQRRLLPLIGAHAALDVIALFPETA